MYNLIEEQEIARAVAAKVNNQFIETGMNEADGFFEAQKAYHHTLKTRALRFLKDIDQKLDSLSNQEIADLLRVLIAGGLNIETEEELEYYIALLERMAFQRLSNTLAQMKSNENAPINDIKGLIGLVDALKILHLKRQPKDKNSAAFKKWQKMLQDFEKAKKQFKKLQAKSKQNQTGRRQTSKKESNSNNDDGPHNELISKMTAAGVIPNGPYWNDVLASYENATDKIDFVSSWVVDEARRDEEKKEQNQNERPLPSKEKEKKPEKSDQEKIDELRMGKKQANEEKIDQSFQTAGAAQIAKEAAEKKLDKTGQQLTDKDIAAIKTKIISGR
ncbi:MAG: hypothetical protein IKR60_00375 [Alphaproteobacteria bacterium]|nr:hypothetical protein [Alphaproteobacteria bacterium]